MDKKQIEEIKKDLNDWDKNGLGRLVRHCTDLIAHIEWVEAENATYKAVVEKAGAIEVAGLIMFLESLKNPILNSKLLKLRELQQALQAVKEWK